MWKLVAHRVAVLVPLLFAVTLVTFSIADLLPGDPAEIIVGDDATQEQVELVRERLGLDRPWVERYGDWLGDVATGDLGTSYYNSTRVTDTVTQRLPVTLSLTFGAVAVALVVGVTAGVLSALRAGSWIDRSATAAAAVGQAIPNFWFGLLLVSAFAVTLGWFPATGYTGLTDQPLEWLRCITLPSIALGTSAAAIVARQTRGSLIDVLRKDYVRAAVAQGLSARRVIVSHALRNALVPVITVLGFQVTILLGGAIIVEQVFGMNGLGSLAVSAVRRRDVPVVQGLVLVSVIVVVAVQLLTDVLYALLQPKARLA